MEKNSTWLCAFLLVPLLAVAEAPADTGSGGYTSVPASPDGIGKVYMGREIAKVMSYSGAYWLERPERREEEKTDRVLAALELKRGMAVADVGAGSGYYSSRMAERVGPSGTVYAVDVQPEMIEILRLQMKQRRVTNVKPILGTATDPRLPQGALDLALMVDVYHELEYPYEMLAAIVRALKPGGRVVFVEFRGDDPQVPIKALHTMTEAQVRKEAAVLPLDWVKTVGGLPWQHLIVFRKR
ncbi:MAG TPA: methyltransferase domain-containing protein [Burkholderiales bacterium]|nr:methyltransferase domain-containing protein [Burkholderiales bacterium]